VARSIVLQFGTRNLKKAAEQVKLLVADLKRASKDLRGDARRAANRLIRQEQERGRLDLGSLKANNEFRDRSRRVQQDLFSGRRDDGQNARLEVFQARTGAAGRVIRGIRAARQVARGDLLSGLSFAATLAPGTPARVAVAAARIVLEVVTEQIEKREAQQREISDALIREQFDEIIRRFDIAQRINEDIQFREIVARNMNREARAIQMHKVTLRPGGLGGL
jgi:hypothetical protein